MKLLVGEGRKGKADRRRGGYPGHRMNAGGGKWALRDQGENAFNREKGLEK